MLTFIFCSNMDDLAAQLKHSDEVCRLFFFKETLVCADNVICSDEVKVGSMYISYL